jgi:hypothetical protein
MEGLLGRLPDEWVLGNWPKTAMSSLPGSHRQDRFRWQTRHRLNGKPLQAIGTVALL